MIYRNRSSVIHFALVDAVDGSAVTSGTVSAYITKDGATQASVSGSATHEGNGQWSLPLSATETDAMSLGVLILESGSVPVHLQLFPQYRDPRLWYADANASNSIDGLTPETPFDNLGDAKDAAAAGDTIIVKPGTYNEKDLAKNGVNWHFEQGAAVTYTGSGNGGIFDDTATGANGATSFAVTGFGKFTNSGTGSSNDCIRIGNASSVISIECREVVSTVARGVGSSGGVLRLKAELVKGPDAAFDLVGGQVIADVQEVWSTSGFAVEVDSDAPSVVRSGYVHSDGETAIIFATGSAPVLIEGAIIESAAAAGDGVVFMEGGTGAIHLAGCVIRDSGAGSAAVLAGGSSTLTVSNCYYDKSRTSGTIYDVTPIDANGYAKSNAEQIGGVTAVVPLNSTETQAAAASALAAYDPPTNAELEARTIVAANYATAANLATALSQTTASAIRSAVGLASANLDTQFSNIGGGSAVSADVVSAKRTWIADDYRARNIVEVEENFAGVLALKPDLHPGTTIASVDSVSITGAATVTATSLTVDRSKTKAHFTVPALTTTGTYTVVVTVTTIEGDVIPTTATLKVY